MKVRRNKTKSIVVIIVLLVFCVLVHLLTLPGRKGGEENDPSVDINGDVERKPLKQGECFEPGSYIYFENVEFLYDGEYFHIRNDRDENVMVTATIVGVKEDGTYERLQYPQFGGVDKEQYQKDLEENGWAIEHLINTVEPGGTLEAKMSVFDFAEFGDEYPEADIDGDGFYDIIFSIHPQTTEGYITTSTDDPVSDPYKIKAD